jgi:putative FmdB family regulatory protein
MPLHDYKCMTCDHEIKDEFRKMVDLVPVERCPMCGHLSMIREVPLVQTDMRDFSTPIEMYSVAVQDLGEIRRLQRECPDAVISDDPKNPLYGVPIAKHRKAKLRVLKVSHFEERN